MVFEAVVGMRLARRRGRVASVAAALGLAGASGGGTADNTFDSEGAAGGGAAGSSFVVNGAPSVVYGSSASGGSVDITFIGGSGSCSGDPHPCRRHHHHRCRRRH